jgi:CRISPR-associated endonuclease/helicase Cas3
MWMSATIDEALLRTVDCNDVGETVELDDEDRAGPLGRRLAAAKTVRHVRTDREASQYPKTVAAALAGHHRAGTRTIAVLNTVDRARAVASALLLDLEQGGADDGHRGSSGRQRHARSRRPRAGHQ